MKKILICGGAGFIGTNLIKILINKKSIYKIYSLDNYSTGSSMNHIKNKKVKYIKGNTININKINFFKNIKIDTVFHFAEFSRIVPSFDNLELCWKTNSIGTFEVLNFTLNKNSKLIYSASSSTFGLNRNLSPYSWTKYTNNELIKNFSKWFGLEYVIVYFYNVYGPHQIYSGPMTAVIGIFEKQYLSNKPLTVVKPGTQSRDFTHVEDIVKGTYLAATKTKNSEFHLGSGKKYSILQVVRMFNSKYKFLKERPGERFYGLSNRSKALKILKYKPNHNLGKYIKNFIRENKFK